MDYRALAGHRTTGSKMADQTDQHSTVSGTRSRAGKGNSTYNTKAEEQLEGGSQRIGSEKPVKGKEESGKSARSRGRSASTNKSRHGAPSVGKGVVNKQDGGKKKILRSQVGSEPDSTDSRLHDFDEEVVSVGAKSSKSKRNTNKAAKVDRSRRGKETDTLSLGSDQAEYNRLTNLLEKERSLMDQDQLEETGDEEAGSGIDIEDDDMYNKFKQEQEEKLRLVDRRQKRASRIHELEILRAKIIEKREMVKQLEWDLKVRMEERTLEENDMVLRRQQKELELRKRKQRQQQELEQLRHDQIAHETAEQQKRTGRKPVKASTSAKGYEHGMGENPLKAQLDPEAEILPGAMVGIGARSKVQKMGENPPSVSHVAVPNIVVHGGPGNPWNTVDVVEMQKRAEKLVEAKKMQREKREQQQTFTVIDQQMKPNLGSCPNVGAAHLHKLGLLPQNMYHLLEEEQAAGISGTPYPEGEQGKVDDKIDPLHSKTDPLHINTEFGYQHCLKNPDKSQACKCMVGEKQVIKSGKWARLHAKLVRQEVWPHNGISKKYAKKVSFDQMDYDLFVAGETRIIFSMLHKDEVERQRGMGRLRLLVLMAHWFTKCKNWAALRSLYEGIVDEIEQGEKDWMDDFSGHETMLSTYITNTQHGTQVGSHQANKSDDKKTEVYWCKDFQSGKCLIDPPHMAQIKQGEPSVPVLHICAACWANKKRANHPENDPSCPSAKK